MRFRVRLIGAVTGVTMVTLGGAFAVVSRLVNADQQRQLDVALVREAHQEAFESARGGGGEKLLISDGPGPYGSDIGPLTKYGAIFAADGRVLSSTETFLGRVPPLGWLPAETPDECFDLWFRREHLRAVLTPVPRHPGNLLMLAAPRLDLDGDAAFLRRAMEIVFVVAVAWAALVATWIARRLTRGHEAVTQVARRVAAGDLSARVAVEDSDPEVRQLGRDVNQMIERLSALLAAHEEFVTHAAHELRSPMTTLYGELALALRRARDGEGYRTAIKGALESTQRLRALAESLLTLARIGGTSEEPCEPVLLSDVLDRAARAVQGAADGREVTLDVADASFVVRGRARDLERLFCNLLENAIRHSPVHERVQVTASQRGQQVYVRVIDRGPGVSDTDRDRIFQPFFRSQSSYGTPGTGLGLAIARKVARAHDGDITLAESSDGAVFVVELIAA
ncbi:MAG TPA: HAMP domain-containing sensor histidine kinase [Polyangia bacterium]|nr:HAMP domain-containing sensor histidine kinase [Polyangia bacterium]